MDAGEAIQIALVALAGGGAGRALEVVVGDAGDGETTGGEAKLPAEGDPFLAGWLALGDVCAHERADDVGAEIVAPESEVV